MRRAAERRHGQFAQSVPVELTGMNWLLPMYWSSTAEPWLLTMLPAVDGLAARRWTRGLALLLLAFSVFSASYPTWNPWTHPWLMIYLQYLGWVS